MEHARSAIVSKEIAELSEQLDFDSGVAEILRDVFLSACRTLQVSEPADPLSGTIARTLIMIAIASEGDDRVAPRADEVIYVPDVPDYLQPLVTVVPLQLLAYHIALLRGCDVDKPRNLAKSVTVE